MSCILRLLLVFLCNCNCCCSCCCCCCSSCWYFAIFSFCHFAFSDTFIAAISDTNWFLPFFFCFSVFKSHNWWNVKLKRGTKYSKVLQTDIEQLICNYQGYTNYPVNLLAATPEHIVQDFKQNRSDTLLDRYLQPLKHCFHYRICSFATIMNL